MPIVTTRSVVLQTYPYSDTSKILRLMTRELGPRSAIAKGALRPRSRFGGLLEPFTEGMATLYVKENRELHTLSGFELVRERRALGNDLQRFAGGSILCELVMRLAPEHQDLELYAALLEGLDALVASSPGDVARTSLQAVWGLVRVLGFTPNLETCVGCGRTIGGESTRFDSAAGGLRCRTCRGGGVALSALDLAVLRQLTARRPAEGVPPGGPSPSPRQARLLIDFVRYHVVDGLHLRSLEFLAR